MHGVHNCAAGRLIRKEVTLRLDPLDPSQKDTILLCNDVPADQSTFELILDILRSKLGRATETHREREMAYKTEFFEKLTTVAKQMEQAGIGDTVLPMPPRSRAPQHPGRRTGHYRHPGLRQCTLRPPPAVMPSPNVALGMV